MTQRFPMRSLQGQDDSATRALADLAYLEEIDRQAAIYNLSFAEAMEAGASDDTAGCFRHVQAALFAAIIVYRLVNNRSTRDHGAAERSARLRTLLGLPDDRSQTPILRVNDVRNSFEHIDARLDGAIQSGARSITDWYLPDAHLGLSANHESGLRAFCPRLGVLLFDDQQLDLIQLDLDLLKLRGNVAEARSELRTAVRGRCQFGASGVARLVDGDRAADWRAQREKLLGELAQRADAAATHVEVLWAQVSEAASVDGGTSRAESGG